MFKEYRWTIKDFIRHYITAKADSYKHSIETQEKTFKEAVIGQSEVFHCIISAFKNMQDISISNTSRVVSLLRIQKEMQQLQDHKNHFS